MNNLLRLRDNPVLRALARKCWPKEQHATKGIADAAMRSLLKRGLEKDSLRIHSYQCPFCGSWHTGHGRGGDKMNRREQEQQP